MVAASVALPPTRAAEPAAGPNPDHWRYRVAPGDTLIGVAAAMLEPSVPWQELQQLNRIANPRRLQPGSELLLPTQWLRREAAAAQAVHVRGDVKVERANGGAVEPLTNGMALATGDLVRSAADASATLRFVDGSRLLTMPASELRIEQASRVGRRGIPETRLRLQQGGADARVEPAAEPGRRFDVQTPVVNLGVRGTEFRAHVDRGSARVEVTEGTVAAAAKSGETAVGAGFGTVVDAAGSIAPPKRLMAAPDLGPAADQRLERVPLRLAWRALDGASAYRAQVYPTGNAEQLLLDGRFTTPAARWADLPDGRYVLVVRGVDGDGLEGLDARAGFVLKARPEPPFVSEPADRARVYGEAATFRWARSAAAARYRLQIAQHEDFAQPRVDASDLADAEYRAALPPGEYRWRVASIAADGDQGPFGDPQSFTQRAVPVSPALEPPQLDASGLRLRWRSAGEGASYEYQLARDAQFTDLVGAGRTAQPQASLADPLPGTYHLRVKTLDADGFAGPFGPSQQIDVPRSKVWLLFPGLLLLILLL
jgi:hypothetical protein